MEANSADSGEGSSFFQSLPPYAKALLVAAGAVTAGGVAWFVWQSLTRDPFVPYPVQPDGVVRLFCEELLEERDAATKGAYQEKQLWKSVAKANKEDDYETYICCLQDLSIFYTLMNKPDKALQCINRQVKCIKRRLKANDLGEEYPLLGDFLKCLLNKTEQCERVGKSMQATRVADKAVKIEALFLENKKTVGEDAKVDWLKFPAPRVLYFSLFDILKNAKAQSPEETVNVISRILAIHDYCEKHLPAEKEYWSLDELQFLANLSCTLSALYMGLQQPAKGLVWLKAAEGHFALLPEHPSIILQRTLLLRQLAECYVQLGDLDISVEHMENCVEGLIQIIGDNKEEEPIMLLIECVGMLINLLGAQHQTSPNPKAVEKINRYQQMITSKYPEQLAKIMQQGAPGGDGGDEPDLGA